jgi:AraC-like DNA-binding protein
MSSPLPFGQSPLVRTSSLEEAAHIYSSLVAPIELEQIDHDAPFSWEANRMQVGSLSIVAGRYGAALRARSPGLRGHYSLAVALEARGYGKQADTTADLVPGEQALLCSPGIATEIGLGTGYHGQTVAISKQVVESTLAALTGVSRSVPLQFDLGVDLAADGGGAVLRLLEFMVSDADRGRLRSSLVDDRLAETFVCALLTGLPHNYSHLFDTTPAAAEPSCVRRAEEYIDANAHEHIGLAKLATVTGVAIRTLTAAFRTHRGYTPMAFLRLRRFEMARKRLLAASEATVAGVALSCGFEHFGRFSVGYRTIFGESASETLRRGRAIARHTRSP